MSYVYLIQSEGHYKIGIANDLRNRLAQLQTGNPNVLKVESCYEFPNAQAVETVLHQKYSSARTLGEWFKLSDWQLQEFDKICEMLGGVRYSRSVQNVTLDEIDDADELAEPTDGVKFDYAAMFADGWRMDAQDSRGLYWNWRKGSGDLRQTIYGGVIKELPYPSIEEMRRVFRDGERASTIATRKEPK
jgi:hypothetical protein